MKKIHLGCIADDFTGATDLANNLVRAGMRVVQTIGVPDGPLAVDTDAVVVSLKSRTIAAKEAVSQSLQALSWLKGQGAEQIYFKYCSTFDSTDEGNIGPVTDALMHALGTQFTIATPAFPDAGRSVFKGYLFVGDVLLNESGMQDHPLTPMKDANLVRVLQPQTQHKVGLIDHKAVSAGAGAVNARMAELIANGVGIAIVDSLNNDDLMRLGPALKGMPLVTAGSGVAISLPANFGIAPNAAASALPKVNGARAILSGSCSRATNGQVEHFLSTGDPAYEIDPLQLTEDDRVEQQVLHWADAMLPHGRPLLVYSTANPDKLKAVQQRLGVQQASERVEHALAAIACGLVKRGVRQLVVAGGETSGSVVQALQMHQLQIGSQIDPGVPWCAGQSELIGENMLITLKSGNFGAKDFFSKAFRFLDER